MLLAYRLVRLIETHADRLAKSLLAKLRESGKCPDFTRVPAQEFEQRVYEIYDHLGEWLLGKKEEDVARRYFEIGSRRQKQGVPLSQLMEAIVLTREHLWNYLKHEANLDKPVEIFGELEMMELLEQFFDKAMYYAAVGYEESAKEAEKDHVLAR
ncbi:MAG TPA: hypothetical protein VFI82_11045 [Terriglobales bacterium]|jgi:hypothetical protein|nr:hypothetical protein [Terriglobales bacterium]